MFDHDTFLYKRTLIWKSRRHPRKPTSCPKFLDGTAPRGAFSGRCRTPRKKNQTLQVQLYKRCINRAPTIAQSQNEEHNDCLRVKFSLFTQRTSAFSWNQKVSRLLFRHNNRKHYKNIRQLATNRKQRRLHETEAQSGLLLGLRTCSSNVLWCRAKYHHDALTIRKAILSTT